MTTETLSAALEREHREIDSQIAAFGSSRAAGEDDPEPLRKAMAGLRRHIYLEEEFLFPPLQKSGLMAPIFVMLREHGELWDTMERLEAALGDAAPSDAAPSDAALGDAAPPDAVQQLCDELTRRLDSHNSKEEPIIYPQADTALEPDAQARLGEFIATGQMPDGWVCQRQPAR